MVLSGETQRGSAGEQPLLENNLVVSINGCSRANDSLLWVGSETGSARFNARTGEDELFNSSNTGFSNEVIKTIHMRNDTLLWLVTDFGLNRLNTKTAKADYSLTKERLIMATDPC